MLTCQECNRKIGTIYSKEYKRKGKVEYVIWVCKPCDEKPKKKARR